MAKEFKLPELGENVSSGKISRVMIAAGDSVEMDQSVIELETDKAVLEVPSTVAGSIEDVKVKEGQTISVGEVIFTVSGGRAEEPEEAEEKEAPAETEEEAEAEPQPKSRQAEADGKERKKTREKEREVKEEAAEEEEKEEPEPEEEAKDTKEKRREGPRRKPEAEPAEAEGAGRARRRGEMVAAAPSVRRLAREIGIDIADVAPGDASGRVTPDDVKAYARSLNTEVEGKAPRGVYAVELPDFSRWGDVEYVEMGTVRRRTAENMSAAWASVPHVTQFDKADITEIEALRKKYARKVEDAGGKLTPTAVIVKVLAAALKKYPQFNASLDMENQEIIYKKYYHIGVAVDTERGLIVPVIRDVDQKSLIQVAVELTEIAERARNRKTKLEEMQGGTFTLSNLGGIGGTGFTPIVNAPQVAVLGVARARLEPVYKDGEFEPRNLMPMALSYDHRIIDGADAARFLRWVAEALEEPFLVLLET